MERRKQGRRATGGHEKGRRAEEEKEEEKEKDRKVEE